MNSNWFQIFPRCIIAGDSYAGAGVGTWPETFGEPKTCAFVATGGSSIDHGIYRVEETIRQRQSKRIISPYQNLIVSITEPHRFWTHRILKQAHKAADHLEPEKTQLIRTFDVPDWESRQVRNAIRTYWSISRSLKRTVVLFPFGKSYPVAGWTSTGLLPPDDEQFWLLPVDFNTIREQHHSDDLPNHMPDWCRASLVRTLETYIKTGEKVLEPCFDQYLYTWRKQR